MNRTATMIITPALAGVIACTAHAAQGNLTPEAPVDAQALAQWQDMKFGLFMHWGLYSQTAGYWNGQRAKSSGHIMLYEKIPVATWGDLAKDFNPVKFNADTWVLAAKNAGMKYLVITTKHHDGLAMFNSPSSDFDLTDKSPFKRDPMKELADACHTHGIRLGFYYSLGRDWADPDCPTLWPQKGGRSNTWDFPNEDAKVFHTYFERKAKPQITELLTQYGDLGIMWFDTPEMISREESAELRRLIRARQPTCIINSRIGHNLGDYNVREQNIGGISRDPWESCITMARAWNYDRDEKDTYKSPELLTHQLIEIASKGGNYLLNIGPRADGTLTEESLERLKVIGEWMAVNGDGIYGTRPWITDSEALAAPAAETKSGNAKSQGIEGKDAVNDVTAKPVPSEVRFTTKGKCLYAFLSQWSQKTLRITSLPSDKSTIAELSILGHDGTVTWKQTSDGLTIDLPDDKGTKAIPIRCIKMLLK